MPACITWYHKNHRNRHVDVFRPINSTLFASYDFSGSIKLQAKKWRTMGLTLTRENKSDSLMSHAWPYWLNWLNYWLNWLNYWLNWLNYWLNWLDYWLNWFNYQLNWLNYQINWLDCWLNWLDYWLNWFD